MTKRNQRKVFLDGEGDAWFERNFQRTSTQALSWVDQDPLANLINNLPLPLGPEVSVFEVGCGQGLRIAHLHTSKGWTVSGLDPSSQAIDALTTSGYSGFVGTADSLPLSDNSLDLLIYGFCLYLCDRDDLFSIASEAHRVLKSQAWLAILDFWTPYPLVNSYQHSAGVYSYKADLPSMFTWHPSYVITDHQLRHHSTRSHTDEPQEWVAATVLRKYDDVNEDLR